MAVYVMHAAAPASRSWSSGVLDCCAAGAGTCLYAFLCPCCAAGDVAAAAGRDFGLSCCVIPLLLACCTPCFWAKDRAALAARHGVDDPCRGIACLAFWAGGHGCLLAQELAHIAHERRRAAGGGDAFVGADKVGAPAFAGASYQAGAAYAPPLYTGGQAPYAGGAAPYTG